MEMDFESLKCFLAAAQHLNFRIAANAVGLSPAAFGDRIRRLEDTLDAQLFARTTRRVLLTPAGERLVSQAKKCLREAERCGEVVQAVHAPFPFDLKIGTRYELGLSFLVPALKQLEAIAPHRHLHLFFGDSAELLRRLKNDQLDVILTSFRLTQPDLHYVRLHPEEYAFVGSPKLLQNNPLKQVAHGKKHLLFDAHQDLPLFRYFLDARPADEDWNFERIQFLGTIAAIRARVLEGAGIAVLPEYFIKKDLEDEKLVRIMPRTKLVSDWFRLVWREGHSREEELRFIGENLSRIPLS
jgi:LysR family transcriptional regulator, glycine cleavage system transcriptional activator